MVNYTCPKCNVVFPKKYNYEKHINKKFSCNQIKNESILNPDENLSIQNESKNNKIDFKIEENENINFCCNFCNKKFFNKSNLTKHLKNNSCKVKKYQDEQKENIFKLLLERDEQINKLNQEKQKLLYKIEEDNKKREEETNKKLIKLEEENKKNLKNMEEYIRKITDLNLDLNSQVKNLMEKLSVSNTNITNNNIVNNNINNINISTDKLVDFGKEDIKEIDLTEFNKIFGKVGKHIFTTSAGNIWNNKPKYKNLYVSDLSRDKAMTVKNGKFELTPLNTVLITINQQLLQYFKYNLEQLEKLGDKKKLKNFDDNINKYYKMYFRAYADAKDRFIPDDKRLDEFDRVVNKELTEYFYNIRDDVKNNYNKIVDDIKKDNILQKINYEPPKKPRGRPKKITFNILEGSSSKKISTDIIDKTNKETKPKLRNLCNMSEFSEEEIIKVGLEVDEKLKEWKKSLMKRNLFN